VFTLLAVIGELLKLLFLLFFFLIKRTKNQALYKNLAKNCSVRSKYKNLLLAVAANSLYFLTAPTNFLNAIFIRRMGLGMVFWYLNTVNRKLPTIQTADFLLYPFFAYYSFDNPFLLVSKAILCSTWAFSRGLEQVKQFSPEIITNKTIAFYKQPKV
jgi:hypothetical protein